MNAGFPRGCRAYVSAMVVLGAVPLGLALGNVIREPLHPGWLILAALSLLSGPLAIRIPSISATISVSEAFIFGAGLLFGPPAATITAALDGLGVSLWNRHRSLNRTLFNITEPAVSVTAAMWVFFSLSGATPLLHQHVAFQPLIVPLLALTIAYFSLNTLLLALAVWLETGTSPVVLFRKHLSHLALDFSVSLSLGAVIVQTSANVTVAAILVLVPMLLASYLSSHYVAGRLEETDRHLVELRRLYDSTVETLAMAVDAKDQVTHGHIRRVQILSTRLARALGASEDEVRALEAAALLHDLGKLAVPERILNKPGPLTPVEYEQMKSHAAIGAGILSRIEFPFPVVPIVRHHHENWDGTGYPDGLRGQHIPLGARILSVVDCFDALTSDRPYRRRMAPDDAVEIIGRRAGQMYDPDVVDAFMRAYPSLPDEHDAADTEKGTLLPFRFPSFAPEREARPAPRLSSTLGHRRQGLYDSLSRLARADGRELAAGVVEFMGDALPDAATVIYRYDADSLVLALQAADARLKDIAPRVMALGAGVTGWVANTSAVISNTDAALDLGEAASTSRPPVRMCVSAPILHDKQLVGVLTAYSSFTFSEPDRLLVEVMAEELGPLLARALAGHNDSPAPVSSAGLAPAIGD